MFSDPKILGLAFLGGTIPALIWLWFWLKEDNKTKEPGGLITLIFILGMLAVIVVFPVQRMIQLMNFDANTEVILWALAEEVMKFLALMIIIAKAHHIDEPVDWPVYLITVALGFAAFENTLFLLKPLSLGDATVSLLTGQLRFLGSTLLHAVASGILGVFLGLAFHLKPIFKKIYFLGGLIFATALHSVFNFFIIKGDGSNFLQTLAFLWVITVLLLLLFEKLRRMS